MTAERRWIVLVVVIMLMSSTTTWAFDLSLVNNGSFEADGWIPDVNEVHPTGWTDVCMPTDQFSGYVYENWPLDGDYNLTISTARRGLYFEGDMAWVGQEVVLDDADAILFDLKLVSNSGVFWSWDRFEVAILLDDEEVWNSSEKLDQNAPFGEYRDVRAVLDGHSGTRTLKLAVKATADAGIAYYQTYLALWENVRFDSYCEGRGYLREDLDFDCTVNENDLAVLGAHWLFCDLEGDDYICDLKSDGQIDLWDYDRLASVYLGTTEPGDPGSVKSDLLAGDKNEDGLVNLIDFAICAGDFADQEADYEGLSDISDDWLEIDWIYWWGLQ